MGDRDARLTILTEYFHPEEASTAQLLTELAVGLTDRFDVSAITGFPTYHDSDRGRSASLEDSHEGVSIERVNATGFDKDVLPLRVLNWLTFSALVLVRLLRNHRDDDDVVLVLSNPPILPLAAWVHKRLTGTPYVYLIYDMYPDMPVALGVLSNDSLLTRIWERTMRALYDDADRIVVLGDSMARRLRKKLADSGFEPDKISVIPNWEDGDFIRPLAKSANEFAREHDTVDDFTLLYSGNIGRYHELETAIDAVALLEERGHTDIQLLIIGEGARKDELREHVRSRDIENVRFLPFQPRDRLPETLTCGDASLVGIQPEMEGMCVSSKLYSSLAAGIPVLAIVGEGDEVARVVHECDCGAYVTPGDANTAADVLEQWATTPERTEELGNNARSCFEKNYRLSQALEAYRTLFAEVIAEENP